MESAEKTVNFLDLTYYKKNIDSILPILHPLKTKPITHYDGDVYDTQIKLGKSEYGKFIFSQLSEKGDYNLLNNYASLHGRFLEKYFRHDLSFRIRTNFIENKLDVQDYLSLCAKQHNRTPDKNYEKSFLSDLIFDFYRVSLYNLIDDKIFSRIVDWDKKHTELQICKICGKEYSILHFPDWVYYGSNGHTEICFECPMIKNPSKIDLIKSIPELVETCKFIPNSDFNLLNNSFTSKVRNENWIQTAKIILNMGIGGFSSDNFNLHFGSWFKALVESNVLKDNVLKTGRGFRCVAKSGNECNSLDEMFIDNWLFEKGFIAIKEPMYPKHELYNPSGRRRADWLVNGYFIEYFGLAGDEKYDKKTVEKILLAKELDLKIIAVFRENLRSIDEKLSVLNINNKLKINY